MINLKKIKDDIIKKENFYFLIIISFIFFLDRYSKIQIINYTLNNNRIYINEFINLDLVWNVGIGFGLFSTNSNILYNSLTAIIGGVIIFLIYLIIKSTLIDKIFFSIILGGALGNFYDRIMYFAVPDFIDIHFKNFHWFTFNFADVFISIGVISLIVKDIIIKK